MTSHTIAALSLVVLLAACSPATDEPKASADQGAEPRPSATSPAATGQAVSEAPAPAALDGPKTLGLAGLGDLRVGEAPPKGGSWAERGAQVGDGCRTVSSPDYPGVYGMVTDGKVRRITVGGRSDVKLAEGVGVGTSETEVRRWFAGFREEPHKYQDAPAKYLTAPNAEGGDPALRLEIGSDGKVALMHVGRMPELGFVEGCG